MTAISLRLLTLAIVTAAASFTAAHGQDASGWATDAHSQVRLIAGSRSGAVVLGGIEFQLQQGWKTYWRTPGDSGVPPRFDFSHSDNVDAVTVLWPAPKTFPDGAGGHSFGYAKQVILPLRIVVKSPDKPVVLRATIDYAVCEKLCVPVDAQLELPFNNAASTEDRALSAALDTVPKPASIGDDGPVGIRDVKRDGPRRILVDAVAPDPASAELFVEGPTPDWSLPTPERVQKAPPGVIRFAFDLEGLPSGVHAEGAALKLTLVTNAGAYEFNTTIGPAVP